jgi:hypothetical protein
VSFDDGFLLIEWEDNREVEEYFWEFMNYVLGLQNI